MNNEINKEKIENFLEKFKKEYILPQDKEFNIIDSIFIDVNDEISIHGIINKDKNIMISKIGKFYINLTNLKIEEENILNYKLFIIKNNKLKLQNSPFLNLYKIEDFKDVGLILLQKNSNNLYSPYTLKIYRNNDLIFAVDNVSDKYLTDYIFDKIIYCKKDSNENLYKYYEVKIGENIDNRYLGYSQENDWNNLRLEYVKKLHNTNYIEPEYNQLEELFQDKDNIYFYFNYCDIKSFHIASYFAKMNGNNYEILENQFSDDESKNIKVGFKKDNLFNIAFMNYCLDNMSLNYNLYGVKIYNCDIDFSYRYFDRLDGDVENVLGEKIYSYFENNEDFKKYQNEFKVILNKIQKNIKEKIDSKNIKKIKYYNYNLNNSRLAIQKYLFKNNISTMYKAINFENEIDEKYSKKYIELYSNLYIEMLDKKILSTKWKSEYELFKLIKSFFNDTIFQYRANWLQEQSLDIYIPSKRIGFEYQGEQHYKAIGFFGGENSLHSNINRDKLKKQKCEKNNVILIDWKYNENINEENLCNKLEKNGIKINMKSENMQLSFLDFDENN